MSRKKPSGGLWAYLDASGVLERGSEDEIRAAKRAYRKQYLLNYKRKQRNSRPEFVVSLSKSNGEYSRIASGAKKHGKTIPSFLRLATLAYIDRHYITPDRVVIVLIEQMISSCLNEISEIVHQKERWHWGKDHKLLEIEKRISKLEDQIRILLLQPRTLEEIIAQEISHDPSLKGRLITFLSTKE
jgi:hypothetical protein